jgi:thiol-disulfide isomerase/thioredoxin
MKNREFFLLLLLPLLAQSCARDNTPRSMPQQSMWRGTVELPDGISVPLQMNLDFSSVHPGGYFLVGDEKTPIPEIKKDGDSVTFGFSEYGAEIRANWNGSQLAGNYRRIRSDGTKSFNFTATPESSPETAAAPSAPTGNYQVLFEEEGKVDDTTAAKLWTADGHVFGTFIAPDGDYGLLVGSPLGKGVQLSRFTGWQAIAIVLEPENEIWKGKFYAASNAKPRSFVLKPRADANGELPGAMTTVMKDPKAEFAFSGVSLSGETVRHTDDRFKGKALIVDIMGTWCHNCLDEAPVLQQLQDQFGKDGVEIVGLSFEISDDPALAKKNLQLFKDRFGLKYTLLFCGSLDDENVKKQLHSQLDNFFAYPTAIFIDRNHQVRTIHSGFKGPGTGDEFQAQVREFQELTAQLVK